jgi:SAM-dependent methyltransferase
VSTCPFDESYYERGIQAGVSLYTNYRWIPELTIPMAHHLVRRLAISEGQSILDFGCAKGYVVKALRLLNHHAFGIDISDYAVSQAPEDVKAWVSVVGEDDPIPVDHLERKKYDWILAKDVLEHASYEKLDSTLRKLHAACRELFVIVPLGHDGKYVVPAYELDATHRIREDIRWWQRKLHEAGFKNVGVSHKFDHVKENWSQWPEGNGFLAAYA